MPTSSNGPIAIVLQMRVLISRAESFLISGLGAPLFCEYQQTGRVCAKHRIQPEIITFCHFRTGHTGLKRFSAKCTSLYKTAFSTRDQQGFSFLQWAHHCLAIFSKVHEFVENSFLLILGNFVAIAVNV